MTLILNIFLPVFLMIPTPNTSDIYSNKFIKDSVSSPASEHFKEKWQIYSGIKSHTYVLTYV